MTVRYHYSSAKQPPIPAVPLTLRAPDGTRFVSGIVGHLDTAADVTVVPIPLVQQLGLPQVKQLHAQGFGGVPQLIGVYEVYLRVAGLPDVQVFALGHSTEPVVLVGRDFLRHFRVTFDGPNGIAEFH